MDFEATGVHTTVKALIKVRNTTATILHIDLDSPRTDQMNPSTSKATRRRKRMIDPVNLPRRFVAAFKTHSYLPRAPLIYELCIPLSVYESWH